MMNTPTQQATDQELVLAIQRGDVSRFEELISRHYGLAFSVALARLCDHDAAEDLAQEVFLRTYLNIKQLRHGDKFGAWVARLSRNLAIDWLRHGEVRSKLLPLIPMEDSALEVPDMKTLNPREELERDDHNRLLKGSLEQLTPEQRELVLLHYQEGLTHTEIAERLGVHKSTIGRQLEKALLKMRGTLEQELIQGLKTPYGQTPAGKTAQRRAVALVAIAAALPINTQASVLLAASKTAAFTAPVQVTTTFWQSLSTILTTGATSMTTGKLLTIGAATLALAGGAFVLTTGGGVYSKSAHLSTQQAAPALSVTESTMLAFGPIDGLIVPWETEILIKIEDHPRTESIRLIAKKETGLEVWGTLKNGDTYSQTYLGTEQSSSSVGGGECQFFEFMSMTRTDAGVQVYYQDWFKPDYIENCERYRVGYSEGKVSKANVAKNLLKEAEKQGITPKNPAYLEAFRKGFEQHIYSSLQ